MPRPERLLDPTAGPLEAFAHDLRALRTRAGKPSYRAMALQAHYSVATLSEAARGLQKPSLKVTLAYVAACGGDLEAWSRRWHSVSEALEVRGGQARGRPGGADRNRNRNTGRGDDHDRGAARRDQERSRHRLGGDGDAERRYGVDGDVDRRYVDRLDQARREQTRRDQDRPEQGLRGQDRHAGRSVRDGRTGLPDRRQDAGRPGPGQNAGRPAPDRSAARPDPERNAGRPNRNRDADRPDHDRDAHRGPEDAEHVRGRRGTLVPTAPATATAPDRGGDELTGDERAELRRLRSEVEELRHANEVLKAASAIFAADLRTISKVVYNPAARQDRSA